MFQEEGLSPDAISAAAGIGQKQTHQFLHRRGDSCSPLCAAEGLYHYCILQFGPTRKTLTNWKESSSDHWVVLRLQHRVHEETLRELGFSSLEKGQLGSSHMGLPLSEWRSWKKHRLFQKQIRTGHGKTKNAAGWDTPPGHGTAPPLRVVQLRDYVSVFRGMRNSTWSNTT